MPVPTQKGAPARTLLRDQAYARLRDAILDGTLEPCEQLKDTELSEWLGLSRTPIREALARLEEYGLVETAPNRYTRVAPLTGRDARDAFPVVAALHALAASLGVPRVTDDELAAMRAANEEFAGALREGDVDQAVAADDRFHAVLVHASANREVGRSLERLMPKVRWLEQARFGSLAGRRSVEQHRWIVTLCAARKTAEAAEAVRENWLSLGALIDRSFQEEE
ncbi:MAG TPA: GntR family transcriptional regulator [Gaiellaceae bacterium]|nr:GntR family transcriptional regulator [Gaiellaceae bacterium]